MLDQYLVDAVIGGKDSDRGPVELRVNLGLTIDGLRRGHGSMPLALDTSGVGNLPRIGERPAQPCL
jgi:hypothetical protein